MEFVVENTGNVDALNVGLTDDFDSVFGAGNYTFGTISVITPPSDPGSSITANTGYNGSSDIDMLTATGNTLVVGDSATIEVVLTIDTFIDPDGPGPAGFGEYENTATTTSEDENGNQYSDDSQDGTDPDPDGDGNPENNDVPTPITVIPNAPVEIVKDATVDGETITYHLAFDNFAGNSPALNIAIQDNLDSVFGAGNYVVDMVTLVTPPSDPGSSIAINPNYTGGTDVDVLDTSANNTLMQGDSAEIDIKVTVNTVSYTHLTLPTTPYV